MEASSLGAEDHPSIATNFCGMLQLVNKKQRHFLKICMPM